MTNVLKDMEINSTDLCKRGANPEAHIMLYKSEADKGGRKMSLTERIIKAFGDTQGKEPTYDFVAKVGDIIGEYVSPRSELQAMNRAMQTSLYEIVKDDDLDVEQKQYLMAKSVKEFTDAIAKAIDDMTEDDEEDFYEDDDDDLGLDGQVTKGVEDKMMINFEKMTPEDQAILTELQKKYAPDSAAETPAQEQALTSHELNPEVKKALEEVAELKKSLALERMTEIAKSYECIGKKADELAPKLVELQKAGGSAYDDFVAILDELKKAQEESVLFKEFGSNNGMATGGGQAWQQIEEIAKSYREKDDKLSHAESIVKACEENPQLVNAYEDSMR